MIFGKYINRYYLRYAPALLLGLAALLVYAFLICRVTPFGRPWYLYCRELKSLDKPKKSRIT